MTKISQVNTVRENTSKNLISIDKNVRVEKALMIMKAHHFRHLPVVDEAGKIVGIVSDRDLLKNLNSCEIIVSDVMSTHLHTVELNAKLQHVIFSMINKKISAVLVTNKEKMIGIITTEDLLMAYSKMLEKENQHDTTLLGDVIDSFKELNNSFLNPNLIT
ncbi:MAG: CBS domain-containing protein [Bdellovibrionota bacterium]